MRNFKTTLVSFVFIHIFGCYVSIRITRNIPRDLFIGTATSAYQVEGAWSADGKGENIWDRMVHTQPEKISDRNNGDIACDAYYKTRADVALLRSYGFQYYRFSISWARILPFGLLTEINRKGIAYYNQLINELRRNGIQPIVTIYHFDLPQSLQNLGGWTNSLIRKWFADYSNILFRNFGDRVKLWITINEPRVICQIGYGLGSVAPGVDSPGIAEYVCGRNVLLAHSDVFHLYKTNYEKTQKGLIGITLDATWSEPDTRSQADRDAAERKMQFDFGIYAHPIFNENGDFPNVVKEFVGNRSQLEGFTESRLPEFTTEEISRIRGSSDFFGLNYYTSWWARNTLPVPAGSPSIDKDARVEVYQSPFWLTGSHPFFKSVPWGFRKLLSYIKVTYGNPVIYITENGFPDDNELIDEKRIIYHREHLAAMLDSITYDAVRIRAYVVWAMMDNFEWTSGYTLRFGLFHVNFTSPSRRRTSKPSSEFFRTLIRTRQLTYEI